MHTVCYILVLMSLIPFAQTNVCENVNNKWFDSTKLCVNRNAIKIVTITHGGRSDSFWDVVEDAVLRAGNDLRVDSIYKTPDVFDLDAMRLLILQELEDPPDGLIIR